MLANNTLKSTMAIIKLNIVPFMGCLLGFYFDEPLMKWTGGILSALTVAIMLLILITKKKGSGEGLSFGLGIILLGTLSNLIFMVTCIVLAIEEIFIQDFTLLFVALSLLALAIFSLKSFFKIGKNKSRQTSNLSKKNS